MDVNIYGPAFAEDGDPASFSSSVVNANGAVSYSWQANIGGGYSMWVAEPP